MLYLIYLKMTLNPALSFSEAFDAVKLDEVTLVNLLAVVPDTTTADLSNAFNDYMLVNELTNAKAALPGWYATNPVEASGMSLADVKKNLNA